MMLSVCTGATILGLFAGLAAYAGYSFPVAMSASGPRLPADTGALARDLGASGGLAAGVLWCAFMIRRARRVGRTNLIKVAARRGMLAGLAATLLLHAGLMAHIALFSEVSLDGCLPVVGLVCGLVSGLVLGYVGGLMCSAPLEPLSPAPSAGPAEPSATRPGKEACE